MTAPALTAEIFKLAPSAIIELFELDLTDLGGDVYLFHAGTNALKANVVWDGDTYVRYPVSVEGFEINGQGQFPRPKLRVSNVLGVISLLILQFDDLAGAKLTRRRTLAKFLDAVNFPGGVNASADPTAAFSEDIYYIDRKSHEDRDSVEFELASSIDQMGVFIPKRQVIQNVCPWTYRGAECGYAGTDYFDRNDNVVATLALDVCGKRLSSCKVRFGEHEELSFGSFPAAEVS